MNKAMQKCSCTVCGCSCRQSGITRSAAAQTRPQTLGAGCHLARVGDDSPAAAQGWPSHYTGFFDRGNKQDTLNFKALGVQFHSTKRAYESPTALRIKLSGLPSRTSDRPGVVCCGPVKYVSAFCTDRERMKRSVIVEIDKRTQKSKAKKRKEKSEDEKKQKTNRLRTR